MAIFFKNYYDKKLKSFKKRNDIEKYTAKHTKHVMLTVKIILYFN